MFLIKTENNTLEKTIDKMIVTQYKELLADKPNRVLTFFCALKNKQCSNLESRCDICPMKEFFSKINQN